ncbi:MAG: PP2C family protein-serine/threonine phosphatase [Rectinemataceae bacterium]
MIRPARLGLRIAGPDMRGPEEPWASKAIEAGDFDAYRDAIIHGWLHTLTAMATILVPIFFVLDIFIMPSSLLPRFGLYRLVSTLLALAQALLVRASRPGRWSYLHCYFISLQVGGMIALMTVDLGGFNSSYYAGLNLVIIGVNLLMPWKAIHTAINAFMILALYIGINLIAPAPHLPAQLTNNLFFLIATAILAVSINHVRYRLIEKEFSLLVEVKKARDALWSEVELAKRIQTALLPQRPALDGYDIAVSTLPAREVGGDYYDIIQTESVGRWVAIGDVSGHGVDSGLIMMMAQTSLMTAIRGVGGIGPVEALDTMNRVLREDITRLGGNHYMTMMVLRLDDDRISVAGHHQDFFVYRAATGRAEAHSTKGTWLGISESIVPFTEILELRVAAGDVILLFTDGVTEGTDGSGEMYGEARLLESFGRNAGKPTQEGLEGILGDVRAFQSVQDDDMTLIVLKKGPRQEGKHEHGEQ